MKALRGFGINLIIPASFDMSQIWKMFTRQFVHVSELILISKISMFVRGRNIKEHGKEHI